MTSYKKAFILKNLHTKHILAKYSTYNYFSFCGALVCQDVLATVAKALLQYQTALTGSTHMQNLSNLLEIISWSINEPIPKRNENIQYIRFKKSAHNQEHWRSLHAPKQDKKLGLLSRDELVLLLQRSFPLEPSGHRPVNVEPILILAYAHIRSLRPFQWSSTMSEWVGDCFWASKTDGSHSINSTNPCHNVKQFTHAAIIYRISIIRVLKLVFMLTRVIF